MSQVIENQQVKSEILSDNLKELKTKIEVLKVKNQKDTTTLAESNAASKRYYELMDVIIESNNQDELAKEMRLLEPLLSKTIKTKQIEAFENTLQMDLMHVNTRYVMLEPGKKIVSPAGFHPDSKIYTKPSGVVILTDRLPRTSNLSYYDLQK